MARTADTATDAKLAELKRLIRSGSYETLEMLEEAVDSFLWSEHDRAQSEQPASVRELVRSRPR
jgi:hypothetical protein